MYAALLLLIAAAASAVVQQTCHFAVTCPCGKSGKQVTICLDQAAAVDVCSQWDSCKSCRDGLAECLDCPEGFEGPSCTKASEPKRNSRQKRQYRRYGYAAPPNRFGDEPPPMYRYGEESAPTYRTINSPTYREPPLNRYGEAPPPPTYGAAAGGGGCRDLDNLKNVGMECITYIGQRTCTGTCLPGYVFENMGSETQMELKCENGAWTPMGSFPPCQSAGHCDLDVVGGSFNCTAGMQGTRCDVRCSNQFVGQYSCYPGQSWEPPLPTCVRPKRVSAPTETAQQPCRCENGGRCDRAGKCVCPAGRTGSLCESIVTDKHTCPDPGFITHGHRRNSDGTPSTTRRTFENKESVVFGCNSNEDALQGSAFLTCNNGRWSGSLPECINPSSSSEYENVEEFCHFPGSIANGVDVLDPGTPVYGTDDEPDYPSGARIRYSCNTGYELVGDAALICDDEGLWSSDVPYCKEVIRKSSLSCDDPGFVRDARRRLFSDGSRSKFPRSFRDGEAVFYNCKNDDYDLKGDAILICEGGVWTSPKPVCTMQKSAHVTCPDPGEVENADRLNSDGSPAIGVQRFQAGQSVAYNCREGFALQSRSLLTCLPTGNWSNAPPNCAAISPLNRNTPDASSGTKTQFCKTPGSVLDGSVSVELPDASLGSSVEDALEYPEGTRLIYYCEEEYALIGSSVLTCESTGSWSSDPPMCSSACGKIFVEDEASPRLLNGAKTQPGDWPWVVAVAIRNSRTSATDIQCGGALLDSQTLVTAAHCLVAESFTLYFGRLHRDMSKDDDEEVMVRQSTHWIRHKDYNSSNLDCDIGLIKFAPKIEFTERVQPICPPSRESTAKNLRRGRFGYVAGWGLTENQLPAEELQMAQLSVQTNTACRDSYSRLLNGSFPITQNMFCAGYEDARHAPCFGDSGSPLVFYNNMADMYILEGLVSFGPEGQCGQPGKYPLFTKVLRFVPWILENLRK